MGTTTGNDGAYLSQGPVVRVNNDASVPWSNQTVDGLAGFDIINVDASATRMDYFSVSMSHDGIVTFTAASGAGSPTLKFVNFEEIKFNDVYMFLGGAGNDTVTGTSFVENLYGFDGNDTIDGGASNDRMYGGAGNDTYVLSGTGDTVIELAPDGVDTIQIGVTYSLADTDGAGVNGGNVENLVLTGTKAADGTGNALNNSITGNDAINFLSGGDGDDVLNGGLGIDTYDGGSGNDTFIVDNSAELITELATGGKKDAVQSAVSFILGDNIENLVLTGTANTDGTGNTGKNAIAGNKGDNHLTGGRGADTLTGGGGKDVFVYSAANESLVAAKHDRIKDFAVGVDKIDLSAIDADAITKGNNAFTFLATVNEAFSGKAGELHFTDTGGVTMVEGDITGDGQADFQIELGAGLALGIGDFVL